MWLIKNNKVSPNSGINKTENYFKKELVTLLNNITLHCYRYLVEPDRSIFELIFWIFVHILSASAFTFIVISAWNSFTENPLVTTLYDTLHPISRVPFPAIAVCNNNRISRMAAEQYANELQTKDPESRNLSYFMEHIRYLGRVYDFEVEEENILISFQEFLDKNNFNLETGFYDTNEILKNLSPKCSDMLLRCFWKSEEKSCNDIIKFRRTQYGFCCTFNYIRKDSQFKNNPDPYYSDVTGPDMGLIVTINASTNDYFYPLLNSVGFTVQIFNPNEFPDTPSGGISERLVSPGTETFIRVDAVTIVSETDVLRYSIEKRGCMFSNELAEKFNGEYKRSDCIVSCRVRSVIALCNCVPFYMPLPTFSDPSQIPPYCTLEHTGCLDKYKIKWFTVITKIENIVGLEREMEESLYCPECLPSCSDTKYQVTTTSLPLIRSLRKGFSVTSGIEDISDICVIRVFFGNPETWLYKQDVALYWFEIFSNFGGMVGLMAGCSLVSALEIIYFLVKQIYHKIMKWFHRHYPRRLLIYP